MREGNIIVKGSELLRIDDSEYKLALSQINAQLNAFTVKSESTRQKKLQAKGLLASSTMESAERNLIKADATVQSLKNSLAINNAEKETLSVQRQYAELDLARTKMAAPFDVRIVNIDVHEARFASKGQLLFSADATDRTEIEARFPIGQLRPLIASKTKQGDQQDNKHPGVVGLDAVVRLRTSTHVVEWKANIERVAGRLLIPPYIFINILKTKPSFIRDILRFTLNMNNLIHL